MMLSALKRLNLGSGDQPLEGWDNIDRKADREVYPLAVPDGSADEIRASHVLEHFSHRETAQVVADWVRCLKPGGLLRIAVPDFERIAEGYLGGEQLNVEGYVMGGHVDADDRHGALFDAATLTDVLHGAGLIGIHRWVSEQQDCAALPVSLNLAGIKPPAKWPRVRAVMSTPRLGFNDFWSCAFDALMPLGIGLQKVTGAFWEQCLTRGMENALADGCDYLLAMDYDTVFRRADLQTLIVTAMRHPEADALAALQVHRQKPTPLLTIRGPDGNNLREVPWAQFEGEVTRCQTAHFGLTLLRAEAVANLPRPWLRGRPDENGRWDEGRVDPDIAFWQGWERAGLSLYQANRVPVGHAELMVRWPGRDLRAVYQHPSDYHALGKPEDVWR